MGSNSLLSNRLCFILHKNVDVVHLSSFGPCHRAHYSCFSTTSDRRMGAVPGGLTKVSKGDSGVWGVNRNGNIYQLNADEKTWTRISGGLVQVSSGKSVWGVNRHDRIYKYLGNNQWQNIPGRLTNVDVSDKDHVWGVNRSQYIFRRTKTTWQRIEGRAIQVSAGESGVWVVNGDHNIFYRTGTHGDLDSAGTGWVRVTGKLKWVASGTNIVVGVNAADEIFFREGISPDNPTGSRWVKVPGRLMQIDVHKEETVGTNSANNIFRSPLA